MLFNILLLIVGFIILIKGADVFVESSSSLASHFKLSKMLIGLTIVSFGTSAPEFAVSIKSLLNGSGDIVLGNVIGSNIINILLILGICSIIHPLNVKNATVKKELPITLLITTLLIVTMSDSLFDKSPNAFTRSDGIILLFFLVFIYYLISMMRNKTDKGESIPKYSVLKSILFTILGIGCIIVGSSLVVDSASFIAKHLGVSERLISLTIIALGTSLPELVTSIVATIKGEYDIAIGNVVGSNVFNIGIVLGLPIALFGGIAKLSFSYIDLIVMFLAAFFLFIFSYNDYKLKKNEGIVLLIIFVIYYSYIILGG